MNIRTAIAPLLAMLLSVPLAAQAKPVLRVFFIDVEGGQATLFVSAQKESLLVDTGWAGHDGRDAERIADAVKKAGLTRIDAVLITHFHADHVGGVPQLLDRVPVGRFFDHGENSEITNPGVVRDFGLYRDALEKHSVPRTTIHAGDPLPLKTIHATALSSGGNVIDHALAGAGQPNDACAIAENRPADSTENSSSLGIAIQAGRARVLDLGDLTNDKERALVCPANRIGPVDLLIVSHHGSNISSTAALLHAIAPRVAVMDNGERKGGDAIVIDTVRATHPNGYYQLHYSAPGGADHNADSANIANLQGDDKGFGMEADVFANGTIDVTNNRTGQTISYKSSASR